MHFEHKNNFSSRKSSTALCGLNPSNGLHLKTQFTSSHYQNRNQQPKSSSQNRPSYFYFAPFCLWFRTNHSILPICLLIQGYICTSHNGFARHNTFSRIKQCKLYFQNNPPAPWYFPYHSFQLSNICRNLNKALKYVIVQ